MSRTSLLQGASYNQLTLLQGLISYIKQVTLVVYASFNGFTVIVVNNPCRSPLCCRDVLAILSVANLVPYL